MRPILATTLAVLAVATATPARAGERMRYLELINRAHDSVDALAIAASGDEVFRSVPLGHGLRGGGGSTTVQIAGEHCRHDLRVVFRNGRTVTYRQFDVCRHRNLRIGKLPHADGTGGSAASGYVPANADARGKHSEGKRRLACA